MPEKSMTPDLVELVRFTFEAEFRDGKVVRWEDCGSKDKALEALGLQE